jgi:glycosyltransferase involved in cell wall biosynthesis
MEKISAVVITFNEESNIESCVTALQKVAAEVLIIDSNSTDKTRAIAKKLGATVVETKWQGYAATKNFGNSIATNDWILSIDSDEVLSEELIESIKVLTLDEQKVYALDRLTNYCGQWIKHSGWYPEWKVRLFHRSHTQWEGEFVHEQLVYSRSLSVQKVKGKLFHYSYKTLDDHWERIENYARLSALEMQSKGKESNFVKLWISPAIRFLKTYFLKMGFLDGKNGWIISVRNAKLVHLKYRILQELNRK